MNNTHLIVRPFLPLVKWSAVSFLTPLIIIFFLTWEANGQSSRKGSLTISENGHYFLDKSGSPFFWQGDTEWELFRYLNATEACALLAERKEQGFNVIQVIVNGVFPEWGAMTGMKPWQGLKAWRNDNPLTPDEEYFRKVDSIVAYADKLDIILVMGVYHARDCDAGRITALNAKQWAVWLANRYRNAGNVVFGMYPHAEAASETIIRGTVAGILEADGDSHLITMHPDPSPASSSFMHSEFWLSFNTVQTWSTNMMNYDMVRADYNRWPPKPVVDGEARYEGEDGTTAPEVRRSAWWACLAGGFYSYGHRDNWKSPQTWRDWYDSPAARQMKIMGDFFRSLDWWRIVPDQKIFEKWISGNVAARSADGEWIVAYLTGKSPVRVNLNSITASKTADAWWLNPATGSRSSIGTFSTSGIAEFVIPEGWEDAVLYIVRHP